eukprot:4618879-Pleurochrysis_carterae.AAC.1
MDSPLPRATEPNPLGLTDEEQAQMHRDLKELIELYPHVPAGILRQAWQYHHITQQQQNTELQK